MLVLQKEHWKESLSGSLLVQRMECLMDRMKVPNSDMLMALMTAQNWDAKTVLRKALLLGQLTVV
jgi:hypothetical protein